MPSIRNFFGFQDYPDSDYYLFIRDAVLVSLLASIIFWFASFVADMVKYRISGTEIQWDEVVLNALARSIYSFVSTILLFLIIT